jgi:formate dehydrogenase subunit gamma
MLGKAKERAGVIGLLAGVLVLAVALLVLGLERPAMAQEGPALAPAAGDSDFWRAVRQGEAGRVASQDPLAGILVQSQGEGWRAFRNGPLANWGVWGMIGVVALLALFFAIRGRIRIEHGPAGRTIRRFNGVERFAHWLLAGSFIVLAVTGLNVLYGRYVLLPVLGPEAFAAITLAGKYVHNYLAFPFMLGLVMILVLWVHHNFPNRYDWIWLKKAGGLLRKGSHPPARKFNAGQKVLFWMVLLGGLVLSVTGIALMFPFQLEILGPLLGLGPIQEMQVHQILHAAVALFLIVVILAHIYIGSLGMEGAFDAMGSGEVDENWAREHHSVWVEEMRRRQGLKAGDD